MIGMAELPVCSDCRQAKLSVRGDAFQMAYGSRRTMKEHRLRHPRPLTSIASGQSPSARSTLRPAACTGPCGGFNASDTLCPA
jgi:hypothetical protein